MRASRAYCVFALLVCAMVIPGRDASAHSLSPRPAASAQQLIDAVNSLRSSHGLEPYTVSSILMGTAQGQADFMASTGSIQHTGPGGISVTQRLLSAGYPLAGDLSLGGFRSENIVGSPGMTPQEAVNAWTGDDPHLHTMLSPDLTEIGAGVAESDGVNYYVIDCARPLGAGELAAYTPGAEAAFSGDEIIVPVKMSTPNPSGDLYHEVQPGQSLWAIAIAYGVHIVDIQKLNGLGNTTVIQRGDKLLVKRMGTATPAPPTAIVTYGATFVPTKTLVPGPTPVVSTAKVLVTVNMDRNGDGTPQPDEGLDNIPVQLVFPDGTMMSATTQKGVASFDLAGTVTGTHITVTLPNLYREYGLYLPQSGIVPVIFTLAQPALPATAADKSFGAGAAVGGIAIAALVAAALVAWMGRSRPLE